MLCVLKQDFYKDIAGDVERWFDTSNYDEKDGRPLSIGKNKKVIGLFKDELGGKIITKFVLLEQKHMHINWMMILKRKKPRVQKNAL